MGRSGQMGTSSLIAEEIAKKIRYSDQDLKAELNNLTKRFENDKRNLVEENKRLQAALDRALHFGNTETNKDPSVDKALKGFSTLEHENQRLRAKVTRLEKEVKVLREVENDEINEYLREKIQSLEKENDQLAQYVEVIKNTDERNSQKSSELRFSPTQQHTRGRNIHKSKVIAGSAVDAVKNARSLSG
mmetsp:Transcript_6681/g.5998  ORF Transcript_6681/g.5998 Transcript_6681/m.5998 type:complete len:189 (+) Transcript_6681:631-1197(+)|eukprot:CAMPEP_0114584978 /NCGR_PEP_ID=MMETSP0125-20121206/8628_1 /TAXON_ID=485358 ORGANISM="Aristerostoma sp., Strain ATCC 50986" /NCGR_SAMPLE_ID=MMETSP0125 /ASSEMBLY_ACC=CAM_ASM_000245 /LENGTH=188 /DNA_ID=CAMNT_0001779809 /DNA_START=623 /DNA_END=1189 /DNA_ORIENTATION=+